MFRVTGYTDNGMYMFARNLDSMEEVQDCVEEYLKTRKDKRIAKFVLVQDIRNYHLINYFWRDEMGEINFLNSPE